jgi:toxin CptA
VAQWRCNIRISWRTQLFSLLGHGALILLILMAPWPEGYGPLWLVLLTLVVFECTRSQKRIASLRGELRLLKEQHLGWHGKEWRLLKQPWMPAYGVMLTLQQVDGNKRRRLWLASDCTSQEDWRYLRQWLLYPSSASDEDE